MTTSPCFITLIDETDKPLLVYVPPAVEKDVNLVLKYNVLSNISLDYFENQQFNWSSLETKPDIKSLFDLEGVAVYGLLIQQTGLKIIVGFPIDDTKDAFSVDKIDNVFSRVKKVYLRVKLNPFATTSSSSMELATKLREKLSQEFP